MKINIKLLIAFMLSISGYVNSQNFCGTVTTQGNIAAYWGDTASNRYLNTPQSPALSPYYTSSVISNVTWGNVASAATVLNGTNGMTTNVTYYNISGVGSAVESNKYSSFSIITSTNAPIMKPKVYYVSPLVKSGGASGSQANLNFSARLVVVDPDTSTEIQLAPDKELTNTDPNIVVTSNFLMLPGKTYQIKVYVWNINGQTNVYMDNPNFYVEPIPNVTPPTNLCLSGLSGTVNSALAPYVLSGTPSGMELRWLNSAGFVSGTSPISAYTYTPYYFNTASSCYYSAGNNITVNDCASCTSGNSVLWYKADRGVNTSTGVPGDNTQLTTWFDLATSNGSQNGGAASVHPASPDETNLPAMPFYRYNSANSFNFNPVLTFNGTNNGQAVQFSTPAKGCQTVFTVFRSAGVDESTFYYAGLLYGGDALTVNPTDGDGIPKSDITLGVRTPGRTIIGGGSDGDYNIIGDIQHNTLPSIGTFKRNRVGAEEVYLSMYGSGSTDIANENADPTSTLTGEGRDLINVLRIGKAFSAYENGVTSPRGKLDGSFAELMVFNYVLTDAERAKVESYLAIKYGITLTGGTKQVGSAVGNASYDYVNSDGTVIRASNATYKYDVFGLGRDDFYGLNQRISRSNNPGDILTASTNNNFTLLNLDASRTAINGNKEFLLFANNKGSGDTVNTQTTELPSGIGQRLDREWKASQFNTDGTNISNVSLRFDLSGFTFSGADLSSIRLLIDNDGDGDFTTGTIQRISAASFTAGSFVQFNNVNITDGQVITLGTLGFNCNSQMYLTQNTNTGLYNVISSTNPFTFPIIGSQAGYQYDAAGFNSADGFIYGMRTSTNNLLKIDSNGSTVILGAVSGLPAATGTTNYNSGEIDNLGNYYIKPAGSNTNLYRVNLNTRVATSLTLSQAVDPADLAYNTVTGLLYGVGSDGRLFSINPATTPNAMVTYIGTSPGAAVFGALFGSSTGHIYGINNAGGFFQFNLTNGSRTQISATSTSGNIDGAHCVTAPVTFTTDLAVTKTDNTGTYTAGTNTVYTIVVRNNGPFAVMNATVTDNVPSGIPTANFSYSALASSGSTTAVTGTQTGNINDLVSLPVNGTVTYTVTVNIPASFTGNLANTATVTTPTNITDSNPANNSVTDTDTPICYGIDSDGDGIPDMCDYDDDNDGILDIIEDCAYLAQNTSGTWTGQTTSTVTVTTNASSITTPTNYNDGQSRYLINQSGAEQQVERVGEVNYLLTFSPAVPASEIAFYLYDLDVISSSPAFVDFTFSVNGGVANNAFHSSNLATAFPAMNYDAGSGKITSSGAVDNQLVMLKGFGNTLISSIQLTSSGVGAGERIQYSFFSKKICDADTDGIPNSLDLDSDNDGCVDAVEGDENVNTTQLVTAAPALSVGVGSSAANQNICASVSCVDTQGVPLLVNSGGAADTGGNQGQGIGSSQNINIVSAECLPVTPFPCDGTAYLLKGSNTNGQLFRHNLATGITDATPLASFGGLANGLAFSPIDNTLWLLVTQDPVSTVKAKLTRIDAAGVVTTFEVPNLSSALGINPTSAGITTEGYFVAKTSASVASGSGTNDGDNYVVIDINPSRPATYLKIVDPTNTPYALSTAPYYKETIGNVGIEAADFTYNPNDELFYGLTSAGHLVTLNIETGLYTVGSLISLSTGAAIPINTNYNSTYIDDNGFLYAIDDDGNTYRIQIPTGNAVIISQAGTISNGDGANCDTAVLAYVIQGNVFRDLNGLTDNIVNGTPTNISNTLNAILYNNTTGTVAAIHPVAANGIFAFGAIPGDSYSIYITTNTATVGQTATPALALPAGYSYIGEYNCVNTPDCTGNDGTANGILSLGPVNADITQANFGLQNVCYKPGATTGGVILDTTVGITSLSRAGSTDADNWPMVRKGGWIALESKTKGFVPNQVAFTDADSNPLTPDVPVGIPGTDFIEGMMVYDTTNHCLKIYTTADAGVSYAWYCLSTQTCPD